MTTLNLTPNKVVTYNGCDLFIRRARLEGDLVVVRFAGVTFYIPVDEYVELVS